MTSANISNMFVTSAPGVKVGVSKEIPTDSQATFLSAMNEAMTATSVVSSDVKVQVEGKLSDTAAASATDAVKELSTADTATTTDSGRGKIKEASEKEVTSEEKDAIKDAIEKIEKDVKKAIAEKTGTTEEDVEKAMELLGLTAIDLLDTNNMAQLVCELTGQTDTVSLILSDDFAKLLKTVDVLTANLKNETGLNMDQLKSILSEMTAVDEEAPADFVSSLLNQTSDSDVATTSDMVQSVVSGSVSTSIDTGKDSVQINDSAEKVAPVTDTVVANNEAIIKDAKPATTEEEAPAEKVYDMKADTVMIADPQESTEAEADTNTSDGQSTLMNKGTERASEKVTEIKDNAGVFQNTVAEATYTPEVNTVTTPEGQVVDVQQIIDQIVEQAKVVENQDSTTLEMILNPEGLGKVFMQVTSNGDQTVAKLFTANEAVKEALEAQLATLRENINSNNTTKVSSIEVSVGAHEFERNLDEQGRQQEKQAEEQTRVAFSRRGINLNDLDELSGLMTEEEALVASMMRDNGNTVNYQA